MTAAYPLENSPVRRREADLSLSSMSAYSTLQQREFAAEERGYTATRHQREVGTGYFDEVAQVVSGGTASTLALHESMEAAQF